MQFKAFFCADFTMLLKQKITAVSVTCYRRQGLGAGGNTDNCFTTQLEKPHNTSNFAIFEGGQGKKNQCLCGSLLDIFSQNPLVGFINRVHRGIFSSPRDSPKSPTPLRNNLGEDQFNTLKKFHTPSPNTWRNFRLYRIRC